MVSKTVVLLSPCSLDDASVKNQLENFFQKRFGGYKKGCTFAARFERETRMKVRKFFENIGKGKKEEYRNLSDV